MRSRRLDKYLCASVLLRRRYQEKPEREREEEDSEAERKPGSRAKAGEVLALA